MSTGHIFEGVRIIELAQYVFVPGATALLADQGAEVIHVEPPTGGDPYRVLNVGDGREAGSINYAMEQNNRNKKSIAIDLKTEQGREVLLKLIESADIFLTSLRPKAIKALKLEAKDLRKHNPGLIYARGNGLGFSGKELNKPGFDASAFYARGGMGFALTSPGAEMPSPRPAMGDHIGSMAIAYGLAGALYKRAITGKGSDVDVSLLSTATWVLSADISYSQSPGYDVHGHQARRSPLRHNYKTRDGRIIMLMLLDPRPHWAPLCQLLDLTELIEDPRFSEQTARMQHSDALIDLIQARIGQHDWSHWKPVFEAWDAPWELVQTIEEVKADPQVLANDMLFDIHVNGQKVLAVASPVTFDGKRRMDTIKPSPSLGEHTLQLLRDIGYSPEALNELKAQKVIG